MCHAEIAEIYVRMKHDAEDSEKEKERWLRVLPVSSLALQVTRDLFVSFQDKCFPRMQGFLGDACNNAERDALEPFSRNARST